MSRVEGTPGISGGLIQGRTTPRRQTTNQITGRRRWWALAAVMISMFFSSLDQTVISTATPTIISDLQGFNLYTWMFTAYILTSAVTVPLYGRLSDTYGRKPFYVFGLSVFLIGSALCGMAHSMQMLISARALQGIGGGAMMSMPRATIGDIFNPRERGRWMGVIMSVFGLASLIGPALGGWLTDHLSWRWVFYINMPVALLALGMVHYALPNVRTTARHRLDWPGSLLLAVSLALMLLGFTWGGSVYAWTSRQEFALFAVAAVGLGAFILNERRASEPIIELKMFQNTIFVATMIISLLIMMTLFSAMIFLPLYVQGVLGISAQNSGFIMTPMMLSFITGSVISGQLLTRTGRYKWQSITGAAFLVTGAYLLTQLGVGSSWTEVVRDMVVLGIGIGSLLPAIGTIIQNLFPYKMLGTVNATQQSISTLAGAVAAPIFGAVMAHHFSLKLSEVMPAQLKQAFATLPPEQSAALNDPQGLVSAQAQWAIRQQFVPFGDAGQQLYQSFIGAVRQALASATAELYAVALVFAVLAFFATLLLREVPLKKDDFYKSDGEEPVG